MSGHLVPFEFVTEIYQRDNYTGQSLERLILPREAQGDGDGISQTQAQCIHQSVQGLFFCVVLEMDHACACYMSAHLLIYSTVLDGTCLTRVIAQML